MNPRMSGEIIRMPFLSTYFNFLKKKFQLNEKSSKSFTQRYFPLTFKIKTTNKPIKDKRINFISYSDVSIFRLADVSSMVLFPIYIFAIPPGWFGRISKTTSLSSQHPKKAIYNLTRSRSISSTNLHSYA